MNISRFSRKSHWMYILFSLILYELKPQKREIFRDICQAWYFYQLVPRPSLSTSFKILCFHYFWTSQRRTQTKNVFPHIVRINVNESTTQYHPPWMNVHFIDLRNSQFCYIVLHGCYLRHIMNMIAWLLPNSSIKSGTQEMSFTHTYTHKWTTFITQSIKIMFGFCHFAKQWE